MNLIEWTPDLSFDHPLIDEQDHKLFDIVNLLIKNIDVSQ